MVIILVLSFAIPLGAGGVTRYAGPDGRGAQPCNASTRSRPHSLAHAIECTGRGDILILLDGTYKLSSNPGIILDYDKSGTAAAHTIIKSDKKWGAKLVYEGPGCHYDRVNPDKSVYPVVIRVGYNQPENARFIDVIDLDISSAGGRGGVAIGLYGHHSIIQGNRIHDMNCNQSCQDGFNFAVVAGGLYSVAGKHQIIANYIYNISPYAAGPCQEDDAIMYQQMHGRIANNVILHGGGQGIQMRCNTGGAADDPLYVANNTITNMKGGGIVYFGNSGRAGCSAGACTSDEQHPARNADYIRVENNIITCGADPKGNDSYGIYESDVTGKGLYRACMIGAHNYVRNNLTWMPNRPSAACPATSWWTNIALTSATITYSGGSGGPNNPAGLGTITSDPQYVNNTGDHTGDYHLKATSPAVDPNTSSGTPLTAFPSSDFEGKPRLQGKRVDLGAYEHQGPAPSRRTGLP
jgi:hypothetical protein